MIATILFLVGTLVQDINAQNYTPPLTADGMEMYKVCQWKGKISHIMSMIYIQEGEANNTDREDIHFLMGRPATAFEQSIIDDALKRVNELLDKGITDTNKISQLITGECMRGEKKLI